MRYYKYVFQFKDHLGNVRLSYSDNDLNGSIDPATEIIEESNYYPGGLKQKGYNNNIIGGNDLAQQWKFGGKEYNQELGLNWYDITARNYDPALMRWMNIDPLAEQMRRHSPYNYAFDNPIYFIDYDGMAPTGPCGDKPCPDSIERIQNGFDDLIQGASEAITEFFGMNGYSITPTGVKPAEEKSPSESIKTFADASDKIANGTVDIAKGGTQATTDVVTVASETVSEAASYTTILTGGLSSPITVPLQKGADATAAGSETISALIDYSDGNDEAGNNKMTNVAVNIVTGKIGNSLGNEATKYVKDAASKKTQKDVISIVTYWFVEAVKIAF